MAFCQLLVSVLISTALLSGRTVSQEIQLQRPMYSVAENISSSNLVLKVCVEGMNLDSQQYSVQLQTVASSFVGLSATDGEDYVGINEALTLNGPGAVTRCTCVEVLEDTKDEEEELFRLRLSGSPLITRGEVHAIIRDNDGISFKFVGNTPRVDANVVTFELAFDPNVVSATCSVINHGTVDCSNGTAQFMLPPSISSEYQPEITTVGADGRSVTSRDPNRTFRTASHRRCSVHLINEGVRHDPITGETTFEWVWTGPGAEGRTYCWLDGVRGRRCFSPFTLSGVSSGSHTLRIFVRRGKCPQRAHRNVRFEIPAMTT